MAGIGKLGLCMAAVFAHRGYRVFGMDINKRTISMVNRAESPINETNLEDLIKKSHKRLTATDDYELAVRNSEATFIVVPTPSKQDGSYSNEYVIAAAEEIGYALRDKKNFHVVALTSTVIPGTTENVVKPIIEKSSGKKCGVDFGLAYNPEFIALGSVIKDFTNPDFVLIGEVDSKSGEYLSELYKNICRNDPPIVRISAVNAEIAKLALNCYVTMKITFANTLAEVCERTSCADIDDVTGAIGLDSRIGSKYIKGGLGYGGPCFPRDNRAFSFFASRGRCDAKLSKTVDEINRHQVERVLNIVKRIMRRKRKIAILGLSYKPNTAIIEDSQPLEIAKRLLEFGMEISVYDPMANDVTREVLGDKATYAKSARDCLKGADLCIVATPWDEFKKLKPTDFAENMSKDATLLDCWRIFSNPGLESEFKALRYIGLGLGPSNKYKSNT